MVLSGTPNPVGGSHSVPSHSQFNNVNVLGTVPNMSSLINQSFGGEPNSVFPSPGNGHHPGSNIIRAEPDSLSGIGFDASTSFMAMDMGNPSSSGQVPGQQFTIIPYNQMLGDQQWVQQRNSQSLQQGLQQQVPSIRGGFAMEPPVMNDQRGQRQQPQLQPLRNLGPVKPHYSDNSVFLHQQLQQQHQQLLQQQQQQQQQLLRMSQQKRFLQMQQKQHLKSMPQQQNMPPRPLYKPGTCARRLTQYMCQQQHRPEDNNIEFWRRFVTEFFEPKARKKWCVSIYGSGKQPTGVCPQGVWHCEICNQKPGRGFEATAEVLPRLFKIKYESGTLEELLYIDLPREYRNSSGQIVLDYSKAIQESVFENLRVVRDGQLRIVFSPDLKICSWEFCARHHEELIPRRVLIPQVGQLGVTAQKYQNAAQNASSVQNIQNYHNAFVASARQLAKALEVPQVNDLGYSKRYVRCLQISEVVNSMKDLIDYSWETGTGPIESLMNFPRGKNPSVNGMARNSSFNSSSSGAVPALLHQNSMNGRQSSSSTNPSSPYASNPLQMPSSSSSSNIRQVGLAPPVESDSSKPQSSVEKILQNIMVNNGMLHGHDGSVLGSGSVFSGNNSSMDVGFGFQRDGFGYEPNQRSHS
ncbi:PREDICTED: transcriptional corepressor SEUSS-like [Tarenaya hassleriana]|uniref:transcriptional corepressor SEUSS-like n=1 Tax=Tarenaya hassleriana TaxID=28532 RepID=UPI00053C2E10|nr:PREDICTED: transcriptional corepressor SEUSS-like [Tarenaya hassleriana]XP_010537328.1 PREDICTED: transcriptional corepressor SEUSS-like [Tarenaya hassleriana]XP_010537329.1 PREDICTED: transcriptional corepressor SEUSS-like [Tarenaya hassleriana]XP_010537330.1 PREDICTED: transcriptional corepressor SEUSS-like [Tarenaya hassleriana]